MCQEKENCLGVTKVPVRKTEGSRPYLWLYIAKARCQILESEQLTGLDRALRVMRENILTFY